MFWFGIYKHAEKFSKPFNLCGGGYIQQSIPYATSHLVGATSLAAAGDIVPFSLSYISIITYYKLNIKVVNIPIEEQVFLI